MTRDHDGDGQPEAGDGDSAAASAETRVIEDQPADASQAETVIAEDADAQTPETRAAEAATILTSEDDRTQLVAQPGEPESPSESASDSSPAADESLPETRVLDPQAGASGASAPASGKGSTRVVGEPDKTAPPPVESIPADSQDGADRGLLPGTVLFGEYEIVNVLGIGGMGEVYRARHRRLDEHRAIKVMHAELSKKKGAAEFFYREAKALLAVRHPAVVHCHDLLSDTGRVYLIMEMIEGIPLSKKMNDGPLSPDDVSVLGARVAHGLAAAHRKGVIHRDISPDNIVLPNGDVREAKLIDFGIAKILEEGEGTIVDGFKGKLSYASPEQLGFSGGKIDGRSDFYSLGLVLAAAALGRPMPMGTSVMEAVDARRAFKTLPDAIPVGLRSAIQPLLALDPKDRPKYVDRLFVVPDGGHLESSGGYSPEIHTGGKSADEGSNRAAWMASVAGVTALAVGVGGYFMMSNGSQSPPAAGVATQTEKPSAAGNQPNVVEPAPPPVIEKPVQPAVVAKKPEKKGPRRPTATERVKIIGLLANAKIALRDNRLMSPPGDNAFDRYERVLSLDPTNQKAHDGLRAVADRYLGLANSASAKGNADQARQFLANARKADASHPDLSAAETRILE